MKLAVFGSTGPTGQELVKQALQQGYQVTTLVRHSVALTHPHLTVLQGNLFDPTTLKQVITNSDAVLSVVGSSPKLFGQKSTTVYSKSAAIFSQVMTELSVKRLLFCTSAGVEEDPNEMWFYKYVLKPLILQPSYTDMKVAESILAQSSLDWIVVRPARLTDAPSRAPLRVSGRFRPPGGTDVSRVDLAGFMLNQVSSEEWVHRTPTLAY